ncbi:MAG: efflux RND transporter periplasmic adaptor subunit [Wenzhouxiangellaceae bacterium]|nr:efflux RND transporter periplasmic adaptor subunit [Wenzhouxiangellaceae bacterium]
MNRIRIALSSVFVAASLAVVAAAPASPAPVVSVLPVEAGEVRPELSVSGTVQSRLDSSVSPGIAGTLTWVAEPGSRIAEGEAVARLDARPFELAVRELEAKMHRKGIEIRRLEQDLTRYRQLHEQHSIAAREVDALVADLEIARADLELLRVERDRARDDLDRTAIAAPFDAVVTDRLQQVGEHVAATQPVARLVSTGRLEVRFHGPLQHSALPEAVGTLDVRTADGERTLPVRATVPVSDANSQSFIGYLAIPAELAGQFHIGQIVDVDLPTALPTTRFIVPRDALVLGDRQTRVFVLDADGRARAIPVEVLADHGDRVGVSGALQAGQQVIVRGAETLRSGQMVSVLSAEEFPLATLNG